MIYFKDLIEKNSDGIIVVNREGIIRYVNPSAKNLIGYNNEVLIGELFGYPVAGNESTELNLIRKHENVTVEMRVVETTIENEKVAICSLRDISARKLAEKRLLLTTQILSILNRQSELQKMIIDILSVIRDHTGMEAVGIRLKEEDDYPYFETIGFSEHFIKEERSLFTKNHNGEVIHDSTNKPVLECICGNIIKSQFDPALPIFTQGGSFWTNSITRLLTENPEIYCQICTRNGCKNEGYETVATIPLQAGNEIVGLLQMNDKRKNRLTPDIIKFFEGIGLSLGIAFKRIEAEKFLIQARKKAEENDSLKTSFLANMSHEIRTPLNSIIGFSKLLIDPDFESGQQQEFVRIINDNCNNLLSIISDIMDISKIEVGQIDVRNATLSVNQLIVKIQNEYSFKANQRGIKLKLDPSNLQNEVFIESDESKIIKILDNFVDNAIKFTRKGYIEIGIRTIDDFVQFHVEDTGIGVSKEFHDKIFERFFQIESGFNREFGGNGLGLTISKAYAELLGGKIWIESKTSKGSCFYFTLPNMKK